MRNWILAAAIAFVPCVATAAPMYSDFATIRTNTANVVIGTVHWNQMTGWSVDVDTVVRGTAKPGIPLLVKSAPNESIQTQDGTRVVAFIDTSNQFRWVADLAAGSSIETGVLKVHGFFDRNAHLVAPSMMTLAQLKTVLATNTLAQTFGVTLAFPDGHGAFKPSSKKFSLVWDPFARKGTVVGFTGACLDFDTVFGFEWGDPAILFQDRCPSKSGSSRSLRIKARPTGVDAAGNIELEGVPETPLLSELEYDTFVADPTIEKYVTVLELAASDGTTWKWKVDGPLVDPWGKEHAAGGWSSQMEQKGTVTLHKDIPDFSGGIQIVTTQTLATPLPVVRAVDAGAITSCAIVRGKVSVSCTIKHTPSIVVKK